MRSSHSLDRLDVAFDDDRLVADAGLLLPATLAQHLGLKELVELYGGAPGLVGWASEHAFAILTGEPNLDLNICGCSATRTSPNWARCSPSSTASRPRRSSRHRCPRTQRPGNGCPPLGSNLWASVQI